MWCELFVCRNLLLAAGIYEVKRSLHFQRKHEQNMNRYTKSGIFSFLTFLVCVRITFFLFVSLVSGRTRYSVQFKSCCCKLMHNRDWTFSFLVYSCVVDLTMLWVAENVTLSDNIMNWKGLEGSVCCPFNELCRHLPGKLSKTWKTSTSMSRAWIWIRNVPIANYYHILSLLKGQLLILDLVLHSQTKELE